MGHAAPGASSTLLPLRPASGKSSRLKNSIWDTGKMSAVDTSTASPSTPAWKRLGLKLKRDEEVTPSSLAKPVAIVSSENHEGISKKRSLDFGSNGKSEKRRKTQSEAASAFRDAVSSSNSTPRNSSKVHKGHLAEGSIHETSGINVKTPKHIIFDTEESAGLGHHKTEDDANGYSTSRRKSVTFTPDTKREDGISASNLFKAWSAQRNPGLSVDPTLDTTQPPTSTPSKKEQKKSKLKDSNKLPKSPSTRTRTTPASSTNPPLYIDYLNQFHNDHPNWKFNKNKQTDLLKHIFALDQLPHDLTPAIVAYLSGLRGASARQRVREEAEEVLSGLISECADEFTFPANANMDTPEGRRAVYEAALQHYVSREETSLRSDWTDEVLGEMRQKRERGERAEAILRGLVLDGLDSEREGGAEMGKVGERTDRGVLVEGKAEKKAKKTRKSRTEVSDDSSSDSTAGDESSEDEEEPSEASADQKSKKKPIFDKELLDKKFGKKK